MYHVFYRPGKEKKKFTCHRKSTLIDEKGRISYGETTVLGEFWGSLSLVNQREYDKFGQKESGRRSAVQHTTSHVIVVWGNPTVQAGDVLLTGDGVIGIRKFYVQAVEDPGELHITKRIYCEERFGTAKEVMASV